MDSHYPLNLFGQINTSDLAALADQAAQAGRTMVGGGQFVLTPYGPVLIPDAGVSGDESGGNITVVNDTYFTTNVFFTSTSNVYFAGNTYVTNNYYYTSTSNITYSGNVIFDFTSITIVTGQWEFCADWYWCYADINLNTFSSNNLVLPAKKIVYRLLTQDTAQITGIVPFGGTEMISLVNASTFDITLKSLDNDSAVANQFFLPDGFNLLLRPKDGAVLWYDPAARFWKLLGASNVTQRPGNDNQFWVTRGDFAQWSGGVQAKSANFSPDDVSHMTLFDVDASGGAVTATLPDGVTCGAGYVLFFRRKNSGTNTVTVAAFAGQTIDGAANDVLSNQYDVVGVMWTGNEWCKLFGPSSGGGGFTPAGGTATLGTTYAVGTTYASTGLSVSLPTAGTWLVTCDVVGQAQPSLGVCNILARLYNTTTSTVLGPTDRPVVRALSTANDAIATAPLTWRVTTAGAETVEVQAKRQSTAPPTVANVMGTDATFESTMTYTRVA